jgi:hypothetical protein
MKAERVNAPGVLVADKTGFFFQERNNRDNAQIPSFTDRHAHRLAPCERVQEARRLGATRAQRWHVNIMDVAGTSSSISRRRVMRHEHEMIKQKTK